MKFLGFVVDHSRATLSIMLLILFAGAGSRLSMPVEMNPNVTLPVVMIMVRHDGISPEDGARLLIRPIEKELKTLFPPYHKRYTQNIQNKENSVLLK